jgi:hypothetical protein
VRHLRSCLYHSGLDRVGIALNDSELNWLMSIPGNNPEGTLRYDQFVKCADARLWSGVLNSV